MSKENGIKDIISNQIQGKSNSKRQRQGKYARQLHFSHHPILLGRNISHPSSFAIHIPIPPTLVPSHFIKDLSGPRAQSWTHYWVRETVHPISAAAPLANPNLGHDPQNHIQPGGCHVRDLCSRSPYRIRTLSLSVIQRLLGTLGRATSQTKEDRRHPLVVEAERFGLVDVT